MSFLSYKETAAEGDTVLLCRGRDKIVPVVVKRGVVTQIKGGAIQHDTLIGTQFGSKVHTSNGKGWVIMLHPTPELWTLCLPHRTQILYTTDISMITLQLQLRPGSIVCECGTGSGSLSHALARTIAPNGHLFTFEFHEQRAQIAKEEFEVHKLSHLVTVECRDVCQNGFGLSNQVDAVFLDLPSPWNAIAPARTALKTTGGRLCSFSPCIEQVQRTCEEMEKLEFKDIEVMECLLRPFDVYPCVLNIPDLGGEEANTGGTSEDPATNESHKLSTRPITSSVTMWTSVPHRAIPGHTGYLTFATLLYKEDTSSQQTI